MQNSSVGDKIKQKSFDYPGMGDRVKKLRGILNYSIKKVAKEVGVTYQIISKIESNSIKSPRGITIYRLAKILKTTPDYLIEGKGFSRIYDDVENKVPILNAKETIEWCQNDVKYIVAYDKEYVSRPIDVEDKNIFAFRVQTDSMESINENGIPKGAVIICRPNTKIKPNKCGLFYNKKDGGVFIREIIFDEKIYLKPLNPQFRMRELNDEIHSIAEVLSFTKLF